MVSIVHLISTVYATIAKLES